MGTYFRVKIAAELQEDRASLQKAIEDRLAQLNAVFSTYAKDSELSHLNQAEAFKELEISKEMNEVLSLSKDVSTKSEGYFDVTVGPLVNAWGFGPGGRQKRPLDPEIKKLQEKVGMDLFEIRNAKKFIKTKKELYIDLSAVAKGYAVDKVLEMLEGKGYRSVLVEVGGEVRVLGKKPDGSDWLIGIEKPSEKLGTGIQAVVKLFDMAMATSGSYRNYVKYGDDVFSHTINPVSGRPARNNVISVTVLAPTCALADAYATAFLAMGHEKGLSSAKKLGLPAYFIVKKGERTAILMTESFKPFVEK